jgi:hypothetical protein
MRAVLRSSTVTLVAIACAGCAAERELARHDAAALLPWLVPGTTSRSDVEAELGAARSSMEAGRILCWTLTSGHLASLRQGRPLGLRGTRWYREPWGAAGQERFEGNVHVVVVFDAQHRAERVSLLEI